MITARHLCAQVCPLALACSLVAGQAESPDPAARSGGLPLETLHRVVRHFDFEEAERVRVDFPLEFQNLAKSHGYPNFGRIHLATDRATSGRWSLKYELDGSSLAAGVPAGTIPVLPLADYVVSVDVCTEDLVHARARLLAALYDTAGNRIPQSVVESDPVRTRGGWQRLSVHVRGEHLDAGDLVIELQLLQPEHYADATRNASQPVLHDVRGRAWFDSLTVHHLPQIVLTTSSPLNVVKLPRRPELQVLVRDLTTDALTGSLTIEDLEGTIVHAETFRAARGRRPMTIELPLERAGWYRAVVEVSSGGRVAGVRELHFVVLPSNRRPAVHDPKRHLSVLLPFDAPRRIEELPKLLSQLNIGGVVADVWDQRLTLAELPAHYDDLRKVFEKLLAMHVDVTFALGSLPRDLAAQLGLDPTQVLELVGRDPESWQPYLDEMLINYGLRVSRWQMGSIDEADIFWKPELDQFVQRAENNLGSVTPDPSVLLPVHAEHQVSEMPGVRSLHVRIPHEIQPEMLPAYAQPWLDSSTDLLVTLDILPAEKFTPRQQVVDLLLRGLWGWRAGLGRIAIRAPWVIEEGATEGDVSAQPTFAAWSGLAEALRDRRFAGELPMAEGVHAWLLEDASGEDGAIVLWCEHCTPGTPVDMDMVLGSRAVRAVDPFGNEQELASGPEGHALSITDMPVFIEGIDLELAHFRASFGIDPLYVEARHRLQEHHVVLRNPWPMSISGTLRLSGATECNFSPRRHEFMIQAGEEIRLPLTAVVDRGVTAGHTPIEAEVELSSDREHRLRLLTEVEVGWHDLDMHAAWRIARNAETGRMDLLIVQTVTNLGSRSMNLDAFVRAEGLRQNRRIIAALEPGMTATKMFHIAEGARLLAGRDVRVVVAEHDGTAQLSELLHIPEVVGLSEK